MQPVVVGPGNGNRPVLAYYFSVGQSRGRIEDGGVDANVVQEVHPFVGAHLAPADRRGLDHVGGVKVVQGREETDGVVRPCILVQGRQVLGNAFTILLDVAVGIQHDLEIRCRHSYTSLRVVWFNGRGPVVTRP